MRDWLKKLPLLKKPTIMTFIMLLILDIKSMDQLPRDWLKEKLQLLTLIPTITMLPLLIRDLPLLQKSKKSTSSRDWLKEKLQLLTLILITVTMLLLDLEGMGRMGHHLPWHLTRRDSLKEMPLLTINPKSTMLPLLTLILVTRYIQ